MCWLSSMAISGQMPDAATLTPGSCLPLVSLCFSCFLLVSLCLPVSPACLPVSRSGVVSPAYLPVSPSFCGEARCWSPSLCGQMPDAVTLAPASFLPLVSLCLEPKSSNVSLVSQSLQCCDAGSGVVSPACLPQFLRSENRCCDAAPGSAPKSCL